MSFMASFFRHCRQRLQHAITALTGAAPEAGASSLFGASADFGACAVFHLSSALTLTQGENAFFAARDVGSNVAEDTFDTLFLPEERPAIRAHLLSLNKNLSSAPLLARARQKDGETLTFELHLLSRSEETHSPDDERAVTVLVIDRTAEATETASLRKIAEKSRADAQMTAQRLADLSHEMKTPLTAVIGFAEAIETEAFGPINHEKYPAYAGHIKTAGGHLLDLVTSILDMARLDADRLSLRFVETAPAPLATDCAAMVSGAVKEAGLTLSVTTQEDLPLSRLDTRAVRQILLNLLSNAVKFTSDGGVSLSLDREGEEIVFTVADTGIGMSMAELEKLGPRFTDAQGTGVRGADGAGIGLSLAIRLARLHGGDIDFVSAPGEGLQARVRLPIAGPPKSAKMSKPLQGLGIIAPKHGHAIDADEISETESDATPVEAADSEDETVMTQLERVEAYRRESDQRRNGAGGSARAA